MVRPVKVSNGGFQLFRFLQHKRDSAHVSKVRFEKRLEWTWFPLGPLGLSSSFLSMLCRRTPYRY